MIQILEFPEIPDQVLGDSSPLILNASSDKGCSVNYEIVSGNAEIVDRFQLNITGIGEVVVRATAEAEHGFDEVTSERTFTVTDGDFYERSESILKIKKKIDYDTPSMIELSKMNLDSIKKISFERLMSSVMVNVDGKDFEISNKRIVDKFLKGSTQFLEDEINAEILRMESLKTQLKEL